MARESAITMNWRERAQAAERQASLLREVLERMGAGEAPDAITTRDDDDGALGQCTYEMWATRAPHGGVLVSYWRAHDYARPTVSVEYFDEAVTRAQNPHTILEFREAIARLKVERAALAG